MRRQNDALGWKENDASIPRRFPCNNKGRRLYPQNQSLLLESDARRWGPATQESDACRWKHATQESDAVLLKGSDACRGVSPCQENDASPYCLQESDACRSSLLQENDACRWRSPWMRKQGWPHESDGLN